MNIRLMKWMLAGALCVACAGVAAWAQDGVQSAESPLTNAAVIKLARAGFQEKTLIAIIRSRPVRFDLSPERLIELKKNRVSEKVILAMLGRDEANAFASDIFSASDDDFFKDSDGAGNAKRRGNNSDPNETNIFGSSGGSNAQTRSRGGNGGGTDNTQTNGSATVRILRTPVEDGNGGASPKLDKTPTLKNESVVEMVEAGFSEGTIIRRIEQSPVDFNLAPSKLTELRRRRVTEPIIVAMRAAMGEDAAPVAHPEK
ncbi:MAG TPA: hypothetical protein VF666_11965 [Pyrinomonadaceae bacterium]|jgi:hypothetical protein